MNAEGGVVDVDVDVDVWSGLAVGPALERRWKGTRPWKVGGVNVNRSDNARPLELSESYGWSEVSSSETGVSVPNSDVGLGVGMVRCSWRFCKLEVIRNVQSTQTEVDG